MPKTNLPTDSALRKDAPMCTGVLDYFPDALAYVARISKLGNDKHNPGEPLHWAEGKSMDHPDCIMRHLAERDTFDTDDGALHEGKLAWRALANLQTAIKARVKAGEPIWDEEVIAKNRMELAEKLAAKQAPARVEGQANPLAASPNMTYDTADDVFYVNGNRMPYGWRPTRGDIDAAKSEARFTTMDASRIGSKPLVPDDVPLNSIV